MRHLDKGPANIHRTGEQRKEEHPHGKAVIVIPLTETARLKHEQEADVHNEEPHYVPDLSLAN